MSCGLALGAQIPVRNLEKIIESPWPLPERIAGSQWLCLQGGRSAPPPRAGPPDMVVVDLAHVPQVHLGRELLLASRWLQEVRTTTSSCDFCWFYHFYRLFLLKVGETNNDDENLELFNHVFFKCNRLKTWSFWLPQE